MYLLRQPESSKPDIRRRKVSDGIDPTVAGKFWLLKVFRTNSKTVPAANTLCLSKEFEFCLQEKTGNDVIAQKISMST